MRSRQLAKVGWSRMTVCLLALCGLMASLSGKPRLFAADWALFRGDAQARGVAADPLPDQLELLWKFPAGKGGGFEATAAIVDGVVYAGSLDGNLYALKLADGAELWRFATELGFTAAPVVRQGRVYAGDADGQFYCLDALSGKKLWSHMAAAEITSSANFYQNRVLFGSQDATLYCLDAESGDLVWKHTIDDQIRCSPTVVENRAFLAGCDGKLHIINLDDGTRVDAVDIGGPTGTTPAASGQRVYFGTESGVFFAIDWKQAKVIWSQKNEKGQSYRSSAAIGPEAAIVGCRDKLLHAYSLEDGHELWNVATRGRIDSSPVVVGDRAYFGSADGRLRAVDVNSGDVAWEYELGGDIAASPAVSQGRLVVGTLRTNELCCFGVKSTEKQPRGR